MLGGAPQEHLRDMLQVLLQNDEWLRVEVGRQDSKASDI
jgi:hypothetical protein